MAKKKKRKVVGKNVGKRVKKSKSTGKGGKVSAPNRRDFEVFARGVERLEELRVELNALNTHGFELEVASIRGKLKNVSYIPQIESEMKDLKAKIKGNYSGSVGSDHKEIKEKVVRLKQTVPRDSAIHRKIRELEKHMPDKDKLGRKIRAVEKEAELAKNVPKLQRQVNEFKDFIEQKKKEEVRKKEILRKLDPNIDFLVNDKFNLSLNEIKAELASQLHEKETNVEKRLQEDFETRRKNFERQYRLMERDLEDKYKQKLKDSLMKEVKSKFNKTLKGRVDNIKERLVRENNKRLEKERKELGALKEKKIKELKESRDALNNLNRRFRERSGKRLDELQKMKEDVDKERGNLDGLYKEKLAKEKERLRLKNSKILRSSRNRLRVMGSKRLREREKRNASKANRVRKEIEKIKDDEKRVLGNLNKSKSRLILLRQKLVDGAKKKLKEIERDKKTKLNVEIKKIKKAEALKLSELARLQDALIKRQKEMEVSNVKWLKSVEAEMHAEEKKKLVDVIDKKSKQLSEEAHARLSKETQELRKHKQEEVLLHKAILDRKMNHHLTDEVRKVHKKYNDRARKHNQEISRIRGNLGKKKSVLVGLKDSLDIRARKIKNDEENYRKQVMSQLELEKQRAVEVAVRKRSKEIAGRLKKDFDNRLKLELKAKEAAFEKKKSELALDIQERAKNLFV